MSRYEVADVEEAVKLATRFRDEGRYDWFRGQSKEYPPHTTLGRLQLAADRGPLQLNERRMTMFCRWLEQTPKLKHLLTPEKVHDLFGILQHYGIATHYLDFSTEPSVAGFFAADTKNPPRDGMSCIYCLDSNDLLAKWNLVKSFRSECELEKIVIDVENLWRLQAQYGVFLYVTYNWDVDYPMDRIVFPYRGYPQKPTRDQIYPKHKSPLEQLLDQYFDIENSTFANEQLHKMFEDFRSRGVSAEMVPAEVLPDGIYADAFKDPGALRPLASWTTEQAGRWAKTSAENFHKVVGRTMHLQIGADKTPAATAEAVAIGVRAQLKTSPDLRANALDWVIEAPPTNLDVSRLGAMFQRAWNGMRSLPYTDEQLTDSLGRIAFLAASPLGPAIDVNARRAVLTETFGSVMKVGFSTADKSGSEAWATEAALTAALRPDMNALVAPDYLQWTEGFSKLFQMIYNPRLMFDLDRFTDLFALEIVPWQIIDERRLVLFNPYDLAVFGIP